MTNWTFKTVLEQIKLCSFECPGGKLENNDAWQWLSARFERMESLLRLYDEKAANRPPVFEQTHNHDDSIGYGFDLAEYYAAERARKILTEEYSFTEQGHILPFHDETMSALNALTIRKQT